MQIIPARAEDAQSMWLIEQQTQQSDWTLLSFQNAIAHNSCWLGKEAQQTVAFLAFDHVLDEAELLNIAVAPTHWRKGVATALLQHAYTYLQQQQVAYFFLEVAESNRVAQAFYLAEGFTVIAQRKNYYQRNHGTENAIIMRKAL